MLKLSAYLKFMQCHLRGYENGNVPLPVEAAGTLMHLLSAAVFEAERMEAKLHPVNLAPGVTPNFGGGNVVSIVSLLDGRTPPTNNPETSA